MVNSVPVNIEVSGGVAEVHDCLPSRKTMMLDLVQVKP